MIVNGHRVDDGYPFQHLGQHLVAALALADCDPKSLALPGGVGPGMVYAGCNWMDWILDRMEQSLTKSSRLGLSGALAPSTGFAESTTTT